MPRCTRKGCGFEYTDGSQDMCSYHPGSPVFHEGLKSWSCCQDMYKPVLDFDEFMKIPACTEVKGHSAAVETPKNLTDKQVPKQAFLTTTTADGKEHFSTVSPQTSGSPMTATPSPAEPAVKPLQGPSLEVDDLNTPVQVGATCRRKGCGTTFISDDVNRRGDGEGTVCRYHPLPPIFREGSKGYLCCKRRVLEFDEFMKIAGCQIGRHCFVPVLTEIKAEEQIDCRIDHYQTPNEVHVSVFAKKADSTQSKIVLQESKVILDLFLPGNKRFSRELELFGAIDPTNSTFQYFGTKVELHLKKSDTRSWTVLERTGRDLGGVNLTFGVGGRTGTTGGKQLVLDESNKTRS